MVGISSILCFGFRAWKLCSPSSLLGSGGGGGGGSPSFASVMGSIAGSVSLACAMLGSSIGGGGGGSGSLASSSVSRLV